MKRPTHEVKMKCDVCGREHLVSIDSDSESLVGAAESAMRSAQRQHLADCPTGKLTMKVTVLR